MRRAEGATIKDVQPLLVAGGLSTRMGSSKHLLLLPDGRPLYENTLEHLHQACPWAGTLYISLGEELRRGISGYEYVGLEKPACSTNI